MPGFENYPSPTQPGYTAQLILAHRLCFAFRSSGVLAIFAGMRFTCIIIILFLLSPPAFTASKFCDLVTFENSSKQQLMIPGGKLVPSGDHDMIATPELGVAPVRCKKKQQLTIVPLPGLWLKKITDHLTRISPLVSSELFDNTSLSQLYPSHNFW